MGYKKNKPRNKKGNKHNKQRPLDKQKKTSNYVENMRKFQRPGLAQNQGPQQKFKRPGIA